MDNDDLLAKENRKLASYLSKKPFHGSIIPTFKCCKRHVEISFNTTPIIDIIAYADPNFEKLVWQTIRNRMD